MKKFILTTSALVLIGGAAAAQDISVGAEASLTYGDWDDDGLVDASFGHSTEVTATLEGATASGVSYGGSLTVDEGGNSQGTIWVSSGGLTLTYGEDEFDAVESEAGDDSGDLELAYAGGSISATLTAEVDAGDEVGDTDPNDWDLVLGYDGGSFTAGLNTTSDDYTEVSVGFSAGGVSVDVNADSDDAWDVALGTSLGGVDLTLTHDSAAVTGIEASGDAGDMSWGASWNTDDEVTASLGYSAGAMSFGVEYDSTNAGGFGDDAETIITAGYAAGDNLDFGAMYNDQEQYEISVTASFDF